MPQMWPRACAGCVPGRLTSVPASNPPRASRTPPRCAASAPRSARPTGRSPQRRAAAGRHRRPYRETPCRTITQPDARGHFGPYGGTFVAETLIHALDELKDAYARCKDDPAFMAEFHHELAHFVGRPSADLPRRAAVARAGRRADLPQARGPQPHRRAQDQQHHRPGAARPPHGQAARHRRDRRRPARRGHRHHLRPLRPRMRGLHGQRGRQAPVAERLPHEPARRARWCR